MLSQHQIDIIRDTAPIVGKHAREITDCFYPLMFERYPAVRAFFNQTHQAQGTQRQALANALIAYATHIDSLEQLGDTLGLIAHKHCSLNILPEQYPIVGECLIEAIAVVLGDTVTPEIADAWALAYQQLAGILIEAEERIYGDNSRRPGGWRGEREFTVEKVVRESAVINSFYLTPREGDKRIEFLPGQYIGLILNVDGEIVRRNYSMSDAPGKEGLRISVKRQSGGRVSEYLHSRVREGDSLTLTAPVGDFVLDTPSLPPGRPLFLVTGGVGITPALSMLNSCIETGRRIVFIHAAIDSRHHAFAAHVKTLAKKYDNLQTRFIYEKPLPQDTPDAAGFITSDILHPLLPADRDVEFYFLGPKPFMACVNRLAEEAGIPAAQRHYEFFGPVEDLSAA